jgi:hypothetical protein
LKPLQNLKTPTTFQFDWICVWSGLVRSLGPALVIFWASAGLAIPPATSSTPPSISKQPVSQIVVVGKSATFSVAASGTNPLTYRWTKNGAVISGATSASYTTPAATALDNQSQFVVIVTNSLGSVTSAAATLTVNIPPSIVTQPTGQSAIAGQTAVFSVVAAGTSPLSYQWNKNGTQISGAILASYTTPATSATDNGAIFTVTVTNVAGNVTSGNAILTVSAPPLIATQPASQTVLAGKSATFLVTASGTGPLTYQWNKNGVAISGATSASYTTPATTAQDNQSQFTVIVANSLGTITSAVATLTVNVPPSITAQPSNQGVITGQPATFFVVATGTGPIAYQWKKNSSKISGATLSTYTTPATSTSDSGESFSVIVTNAYGSVTSAGATLTVTPPVPPTIATQPAGQIVVAGQTATFSVAASGTPPLTYQWTKNGSAISGGTSAYYTTPPTTLLDYGEIFAVIVRNSAGSTTSNGAFLGVNTPGQLASSSSTLNFGNVITGNSSSALLWLTNSGGTSLTILNTSISGAGFQASSVNGQALAPGQSTTVTVTFTPSTTGAASGSVVLTSDAANSPTTIFISGTGAQAGLHTVSLAWDANTSNVSAYNIYRATTTRGPYALLSLSPIAPDQYLDTDVAAGLTYYYVVTSLDSTNHESAYAPEVSAAIPTP